MKTPDDCLTIDEVRSEIDRVDRAMLALLAQRQAYVKSIMRFKKDKADVQAPERQARVVHLRRQWAAEEGIDPDLVEHLFRILIAHFISEELELLAERGEQ